MNTKVCIDPVTSNRSKVLDALKSRYTCIHEPLPADSASSDINQRYLTSLRVFGSREVEEPQSPLPTCSSTPTVDQDITDPQIIKEKVTAALKVLTFREPRVLVQFWSPVAVRKRCLLTTLDQTFGLGVVDEELYLYRLESEQRMYVVDEEHRDELGPPGRVYRQKLPEWSLDMHGLLTRQSVQDWPASHNIHGYINLPVFEPRSGRCVGVLELITSSKYADYAFEVRQVSRALKEVNLKCPNVLEDTSFYARVGDETWQLESDEIFRTLKTVCDIHNIPLAQTWGPCGYSSVVARSGNLEKSCSSFSRNCIGKVCMSTAALPFYVRDLSMWGFHEACRERHLDKSQGVVGRSLSSRGLCFCGDVSKLGDDEYPLVPYARMHGITSCLAIYIKTPVVDGEYVVEFFLPTQSSEKETYLQGLVKTVKQHIKNASRIQLGDISSPQVIGGNPLNWNLESPTLTEKVENGKTDCDVDVNVDVSCSNKQNEFAHVEHVEEDKPSNSASVAERTNQNVVVSYMNFGSADVNINTGKMLVKDVNYSIKPSRKKTRNDRSNSLEEDKPSNSAAEGTNQNVVPYLDVGTEDVGTNTGKRRESYINFSKEPIRKRKRTDRSISLEEISKYYGKTMEEAADSLHVSRSTLKRICRSHGIPRWPYSRTPSESEPLLKLDQTDAAIQASDRALTTLVLGTSNATNSTHDPTTLTEHGNNPNSTLVVHPTEQKDPPNGHAKPETPVKDKHIKNTAVNTYTIKVTYGTDIVKFSFRLSDGLAKLEKVVATRFQLSHGSFSLKYEDEDGDFILIACDNDLAASVGAFRRPDSQTVIRLLVWPVSNQNTDV